MIRTHLTYISNEEASNAYSQAKKHLHKLEAWLEIQSKQGNSKNVIHLVNGKFSAPDFHLFEMLDQFGALCKTKGLGDLGEEFKRLQAFKDGFAALE